MALTVKLDVNPLLHGVQVRRITVTGPASYASGGEALTAANFGLVTLYSVLPAGGFGGYVPVYDYANSKLLFYRTGAALNGALAEVAAAVNLSAVSGQLLAFGS